MNVPPCKSKACLNILLQRESRSYSSVTLESFDTDDDDDDDEIKLSSTLKIIIPILIVLGVFVVVAFGFFLHKIIVKVVRKHWDSEDRSGDITSADAWSHRRVNTVCGVFGNRPPSYNQVMLASAQGRELPPPYHQAVNGVTNLSFTSDREADNQQEPPNYESSQVINHVGSSQLPANHSGERNNGFQATSNLDIFENQQNSGVNLTSQQTSSSSLAVLPQITERAHNVPQDISAQRQPPAIGSSYYHSSVAPEPLSIVIHDVDEMVDSISVPSVIPSGGNNVQTSTSTGAKRKRKRDGFFCRNTSL